MSCEPTPDCPPTPKPKPSSCCKQAKLLQKLYVSALDDGLVVQDPRFDYDVRFLPNNHCERFLTLVNQVDALCIGGKKKNCESEEDECCKKEALVEFFSAHQKSIKGFSFVSETFGVFFLGKCLEEMFKIDLDLACSKKKLEGRSIKCWVSTKECDYPIPSTTPFCEFVPSYLLSWREVESTLYSGELKDTTIRCILALKPAVDATNFEKLTLLTTQILIATVLNAKSPKLCYRFSFKCLTTMLFPWASTYFLDILKPKDLNVELSFCNYQKFMCLLTKENARGAKKRCSSYSSSSCCGSYYGSEYTPCDKDECHECESKCESKCDSWKPADCDESWPGESFCYPHKPAPCKPSPHVYDCHDCHDKEPEGCNVCDELDTLLEMMRKEALVEFLRFNLCSPPGE